MASTTKKAFKKVGKAQRKADGALVAFHQTRAALVESNEALEEATSEAEAEIQSLRTVITQAQTQASENDKVVRGIDRLLAGE